MQTEFKSVFQKELPLLCVMCGKGCSRKNSEVGVDGSFLEGAPSPPSNTITQCVFVCGGKGGTDPIMPLAPGTRMSSRSGATGAQPLPAGPCAGDLSAVWLGRTRVAQGDCPNQRPCGRASACAVSVSSSASKANAPTSPATVVLLTAGARS